MTLTDNQIRVLEALDAADGEATVAALADATGVGRGPVEQAARLLADAGLASVDEEESAGYRLTEEGERYAADALPERRLRDHLADHGPTPIADARDAVDDFQVAMANLQRKGWADVEDGTLHPAEAPEPDDEEAALAALAAGDEPDEEDAAMLVDRNLAEEATDRTVTVALTAAGRERLDEGLEGAEQVGQLTKELLESGDWRDAALASYNVEADAEQRYGGRVHILRQLADRVKEVLTSMGFREMAGPHVDSEFYINDCLFMPQDHPARTHWDKFLVEEPTHVDEDAIPDALVEAVEAVHREGAEGGEGYHSPWSEDVARRLNLRGHTTSLSMRYLAGVADEELDPPERYFSVDKVYRNDTLDPTHLLEFYQIEGWVMAEDLSVRDLMGTFDAFYERFGITDLEFKPHYNPYTEPSFEIFGEHPETGELIEIGNSGMFRPEVLEPLGVDDDVRVMAWGLALERLLMLMYGFEDIRDVHGTLCDLELLREVPILWQ